jgi:2-(1,2-epoxy-1,2-dihydrophenyl)acetyl-CoA isomerase
MTASTEELLYALDSGIATITLNRPDKLNAFTVTMIDKWAGALAEAQRDPAVHVVIVTGAGRAFCAGGDVGQMGQREQTGLSHKAYLWEHIHRIPLMLDAMDKPVIAMINGVATGAGLDMALMCDLRIASDQARFAESYVKVGLVPGDGGAYYLPRLVGLDRALELLWTGDVIGAQEAERLGLVTRVVPAAELGAYTYALARRIADGPPIAIRMTKRAVHQCLRADIRTALDLISSHIALAMQSEDHREGVRAFLEKRAPRFVGR